jgi:hypothetical protein
MMRKNRIAVMLTLASLLVISTPAMFYAQAQIQSSPAQQLVTLADRAEQQVRNLIDTVYANETAIQVITESNLLDELEANALIYDQGVSDLAESHTALEAEDYEAAVASATEALRAFRDAYKSIHITLKAAGIEIGQLIDAQGLLEAISRTLDKIDQLRLIIPVDATATLALLEQAESHLSIDTARQMLLQGEIVQVVSDLTKARQLVSQVYDYLKAQAEKSNIGRINDYCQGIQERTQERFRYGREQGINLDSILQHLGYQNETQFMQALQSTIVTAQGTSGNLQDAMQDLEVISQMYQQMNQALGQEMMRRQGGNSGSGGGFGAGSGSGAGTGSGLGYGGG